MNETPAGRPFPTRLWLSTVAAILAIVAAGIVFNHVERGARQLLGAG
ncbi:MAG TPA: hypothetical protein VE011_11320 [Candidatus Dormibacteraeota bacterium]|nr:hypothetical protein [Candidatus Dormibacteraeota bacterium]